MLNQGKRRFVYTVTGKLPIQNEGLIIYGSIMKELEGIDKRMNKKKIIIAMSMTLALVSVGCGLNGKDKKEAKVKLGKYFGVEVQVLTAEPTKEEIQTEIDTFLAEKKYKDKKNTKIDDGETVNIDYTGYVDGKTFEGGSAKGTDLAIGSNTFIEGFESGLIGKSVGKKVDVKVTFPETYSEASLAGKDAKFEVTINYIYTVPKLTDKLVKEDGKYDTIKEFKEAITENLTLTKQKESDSQKKNSVLEKVVANCEVTNIPQADIDAYYDLEYEYYESTAKAYNTTLEEFIKYYGITLDQFKEDCKKTAKEKAKSDAILKAIAAKEDITLSDKEYKAKVTEWIAEYSQYNSSGSLDQAGLEKMYGGKARCRANALYEKVWTELVKKSKVTDVVDVLPTATPATTESSDK